MGEKGKNFVPSIGEGKGGDVNLRNAEKKGGSERINPLSPPTERRKGGGKMIGEKRRKGRRNKTFY